MNEPKHVIGQVLPQKNYSTTVKTGNARKLVFHNVAAADKRPITADVNFRFRSTLLLDQFNFQSSSLVFRLDPMLCSDSVYI
jgi:hypothetical protein